ncbi:MAG: cation:H+ antiporter [Myxococcota bacterium]|jgi:cation:H+ antiporter
MACVGDGPRRLRGESLFLVTLLIGLMMLVAGAELVVRGGGQIALAMRVPALIVGLTIVAFGTSAPELGVSITAVFTASTDMAIANVIGSNIANIALVLGLAALVRPMAVDSRLVRREIPVLLLLQLMIPAFAWNGTIERHEGFLLLIVGVIYNLLLLFEARKRRQRVLDEEDEVAPEDGLFAYYLFLLFGGIVIIIIGSVLFVEGAKDIAQLLGLSQRYVGLTVVALGTSAPEVATSVVASYRNQGDLAVGNALGSNILNITMVLALTAMIQPIVMTTADVNFDFGVALGVTVLLIPIVLRDRLLGRVEGVLLTIGYLVYVFSTPP